MNHDDVLWGVMGQNFCSFKVKARDDKVRFCRNPYNLTGLCSRASCPLANSQFATVIEQEDELYLYVKTAERAHLPRRQWEKTKLDTNFSTALQQIDGELQWWDRRLVNKVKARLLRLKQYLMRKRKLMLEGDEEYVSVNKRQEFKLQRREAKAEEAARIELEIEKELLERLKRGTYDSVVNYDQAAFNKILDEEQDEEELKNMEALEREEEMDPYTMDMDEDDDDDDDDEEEEEHVPRSGKARTTLMTAAHGDDDDDDDGTSSRGAKSGASSRTSRRTAGASSTGSTGSRAIVRKRERLVIENEEEHVAPRKRMEEANEW